MELINHRIAEIIKPAYKANGEKYADVAINASCLLLADSILSLIKEKVEGKLLTETEIFTAQNQTACSALAMTEHIITAKAQLKAVLEVLK